ncbi:MAG: hypothetical protein IPJ69_06745 [Deltaproteobacteria bacterium]|nr:MAG: hypothetical protein IPJ69_06745 [Deltaproteobacteria bacterium]
MKFPLRPEKIFVDQSVWSLETTQKILSQFPNISAEKIADVRDLKNKTGSKKLLLLTRKKSEPLKEFKALALSAEIPYYSLDVVSNCHLECTYCILQSYLENNPILTIYTNIDEILESLSSQIKTLPLPFMIGTGRIADSLALEPVTGYAKKLISFFAHQDGPMLELKTKSDFIDGLLDVDHCGKTIISWSLSPEFLVKREEVKTATLEERLAAMKKVAQAGYKVGIHMDPVIIHHGGRGKGWKENYAQLIDRIFQTVSADQIHWMSVGTLRLPNRQKKIMEKRFPKNNEIFDGLISTNRRFIHYPKDLREEIYDHFNNLLEVHIPQEKVFSCMEESLK